MHICCKCEDSNSILNQNAFNIFQVHYGLTISIVDGDLRKMINAYYGFIWSTLQDMLSHDPGQEGDPDQVADPD